MLKIIPLVTAALLALSLPLIAQDGGQVLRVIEAQDQIIQVRAKTRHTTVIVLPATENVLDFVVGDSEYWHLTGAANLAFLKPIAEGVTTNVALVCASGRIYSFLVTERSAGQPHLVVRVEAQGDANPRISPTGHEPAFVARSQVAAYQQMAKTAIATAKAVQVDADTRIAEAAAEEAQKTEAFRAEYPTRLKFPYRLEDKAKKWPFLVEGMWHDGRFTYLRANPRSRPRCTKRRTGNRRWWPTIWARTGCISPVTFWVTAGCRSANKKSGGASRRRRSGRDRLAAALSQTGGIAARRHRHTMGRRDHHHSGPRVSDVLDLFRRRQGSGACAGHGDGTGGGSELRRSNGRAGRSGVASSGKPSRSGGAGVAAAGTAATTTGGQRRRDRRWPGECR